MKQTGILIFLLISLTVNAQVSKDSELFRTLKTQDSTFFEQGFNQCDMEYLKGHISDDLKFFHDQGGFQDKDIFFDRVKKSICSGSEKKPIRKVDTNSLEVFPLYNNGELYGAIQTGIHNFYLREQNKEDKWSSTAKFTHVWILDNGIWKISEVLSYDHQDKVMERSLSSPPEISHP